MIKNWEKNDQGQGKMVTKMTNYNKNKAIKRKREQFESMNEKIVIDKDEVYIPKDEENDEMDDTKEKKYVPIEVYGSLKK